jgi:hypothetical protein
MDPTSTGSTLLRDTDNLQTDLDWAVDTASTDHMLDRPGCPNIPPNAPRTAPPMCRSGTPERALQMPGPRTVADGQIGASPDCQPKRSDVKSPR